MCRGSEGLTNIQQYGTGPFYRGEENEVGPRRTDGEVDDDLMRSLGGEEGLNWCYGIDEKKSFDDRIRGGHDSPTELKRAVSYATRVAGTKHTIFYALIQQKDGAFTASLPPRSYASLRWYTIVKSGEKIKGVVQDVFLLFERHGYGVL